MQRQKRSPLSVHSLRQAVSLATLIRPAANSNLPTGPRLIAQPASEPTQR